MLQTIQKLYVNQTKIISVAMLRAIKVTNTCLIIARDEFEEGNNKYNTKP